MRDIDGVEIEYGDGTVEKFNFKDKKASENIDSMLFSKEESEESFVVCSCENNKFYSYTNVANLTMEASDGKCYGFITFGDSSPTITIGDTFVPSGDDINNAGPGETWEFSVYSHNGKSYIIWKNWGV